MNIEGYLAGSELQNANVIKEQVIRALGREGLLNGTAEDIVAKYAVVMHRRSWLGSAWARLWGNEVDSKSEYRVDVVKLV